MMGKELSVKTMFLRILPTARDLVQNPSLGFCMWFLTQQHWIPTISQSFKRSEPYNTPYKPHKYELARVMTLRKDTLMAQNLLLLGFVASAHGSGTSHEATQAVVPSMFDRPNEKLLFSTLHFLLLRLQPAIAQVREWIVCVECTSGTS